MYPKVGGHSVFGPEALGTHLTFSAGVTELGWSYRGDLSPCFTHAAWSSSIRLVYRQSWGWREEAGGEAGRCYGHVCISKTRREDDWKKGLQWIFSHCWRIHVWFCLALLHSQASVFTRPENHSPLPPFFFVFLLFCSPASPHSCFLYYFISVSESLSLPPPLSHSSSFLLPSFSFSLPPSLFLPLPIFACATFNWSDMPCGKLCLCVLEQALLVMAVIPDARGGV